MKKFILSLVTLLCVSESAMAVDWCKSAKQRSCMEATIWGEARGEGATGMLWVGMAIATRMSRGYASTVCSVVSGAAFAQKTPRDTANEHRAFNNMKAATDKACKMGDQGVTHFHSFSGQCKSGGKFMCGRHFTFVKKLGAHYFFNGDSTVKADYVMNGEGSVEEAPEGQLFQTPFIEQVPDQEELPEAISI